MIKINSVDEFVEALGGTLKTAELFGVSGPAVSNWRGADKFPAWVLGAVRKLSELHGLEVDDRLYETTKPGQPPRAASTEKPNEAAE